MAWNREIKPEEILGMKPEELKAKLDGAITKEQLDAALATQNGSLKEIQASLAKLTTPKAAEPVTDPADPDPTVAVLTDPTKFVDDRLTPVAQRGFKTQADLEEMRARAKYRGVFDQFGEELMKTAEKFTWQNRAMPNFWDMHVANLVGTKTLSGEIKSGQYPSLLGTSAHGPRADGSTDDPNMGFSDDMALWFRNRGLPIDKARKIYDLTIRDGEPMTIAKYTGKAAS